MATPYFFLSERVSQVKSKNLTDAPRQEELPISRIPKAIEIPIELIRSKKNSGAAFTLACDSSGMDDKEIYLPLGIDAGYFSRMKKGEATLQGDLIRKFCDHVGNRIFIEWQAFQIGCTLQEIESETQRQLRIEREKLAEAERENALLRNLLVGRSA